MCKESHQRDQDYILYLCQTSVSFTKDSPVSVESTKVKRPNKVRS